MKIFGFIMLVIGTIWLFVLVPWLLIFPLIGYWFHFLTRSKEHIVYPDKEGEGNLDHLNLD